MQKQKFSAGWTQRASSSGKEKSNASWVIGRALFSVRVRHSWEHLIYWKLRVIPGSYGRTYVFLHHRKVRWGTVSYLHKYLVCADTVDGPCGSKYWRNLAHRSEPSIFLQASFVYCLGGRKSYHSESCGARSVWCGKSMILYWHSYKLSYFSHRVRCSSTLHPGVNYLSRWQR